MVEKDSSVCFCKSQCAVLDKGCLLLDLLHDITLPMFVLWNVIAWEKTDSSEQLQ